MSELVSIVMPVHNGDRFIGEAIRSVLAQTHREFELIVVDDCSTDGTPAILEREARSDDRIRVLKTDRASGSPAAPRNVGLEAAKGRYVAFLDSDDLWMATKLESQIRFMGVKRAAVSYTAYERIGEDGRLLRAVQVPPTLDYRSLLKNSAIAMSSAMFVRALAGDVRFTKQGHEDYAFWLRFVKRHGRCFGLNEPLLRYRVVQGSVSSRGLQPIAWTWQIYRKNEALSAPHAAWCLGHYGVRAALKRLRQTGMRTTH